MNNLIIRNALLIHNVKQYELANIMGVSVNTLVRKMRVELPEEQQKELAEKIKQYAKERNK